MNRKNFGVKTWLFPMPVLIVAAYDSEGNPNAMNAAWGGIYTDNKVGICLSAGHKTTQNILTTRSFTVSMGVTSQLEACDYVGITSGNADPDKWSRSGFTVVKSDFVNAPLIEELPMALECELETYDEATCYLVGRIVNVTADVSILDDNGHIDVRLLNPILFDSMQNRYFSIGECVGKAFSAGKALK